MTPVVVVSVDVVDHPRVKAVAAIRIGVLTIHGLKVMAKSDGELWVALPSVKKGEGWSPVVEIRSRALMAEITSAVIDACRFETSAKGTLARLEGALAEG